jgi:hypothetical protein
MGPRLLIASIWFVLVGCPATVFGELSSVSRSPARDGGAQVGSPAPARLQLTVAQRRVNLGSEPIAEVVLVNTSSTALWANTRMAEGGGAVPRNFEVILRIKGPDGKEYRFSCLTERDLVSINDYRVISPGQSVRRQMAIGVCYEIDKSGIYEITAEYRDREAMPPPPGTAATPLRDGLISNTVRVEFTAK